MRPVPSDSALTGFAEALSSCLLERGALLATAESCTGGWVARCCTDLAGSSAWFERGFVTYSDRSKLEMLGVSPDVLDRHGAVSEAVALQMAAGAVGRSGADVSLAVTGIAGPDGGSETKPVGTVWFAWSGNGRASAERHQFDGDREQVRRQSVAFALEGLIARL